MRRLTRYAVRAAALAVMGIAPGALGAGAKTPFVTLEAEAGTLSGKAAVHSFKAGMPVPKVATLELEASGAAYVRLSGPGDRIAWVVPIDGVNAIVVRGNVPDSPTGGGTTATLGLYVDGVFRQHITLSSKQSIVYRTDKLGWIDDPTKGGMPFKFYNDDSALIDGDPIRKGSTLELRAEPGATAAEYNIDCIDLEPVPPPVPQPANSLSVVDYGAKPDTDIDSQAAIQKCVDDARKLRKIVYLPPGRYKTSSLVGTGLDFKGVTVQGAGMWRTVLYRACPLDPTKPRWRSCVRINTGSVLRDLQFDSNSFRRATGQGQTGGGDYGVLGGGNGWLIERIWSRHNDAIWLSGTDGTIRDSRVSDSWGDGINLNNGNTPSPGNPGVRLTVENCYVRNTGDDGFATYSDAGAKGDNTQMVDTHILNNTAVAPYWANCLRVAGGKNVVVRGNLLLDGASNSGMTVGVFGKTGQPLESALVEDNEIHRAGGWNGNDRHGIAIGSQTGMFTNCILRNNAVYDAYRDGIKIGPDKINVTLENNQVVRPALDGIFVSGKVTGIGIFRSNVITGLRPGQKAIVNQSQGFTIRQ
ncbi:MAG: right-handed parallel beta-helix repeat-containing protein [Tepidisphaeraceae bacterium]